MKNVPSSLCSFKNKVDKLDIDKLASVLVDLRKLSGAGKNDVAKMYIPLTSKVLKIKYLILLTWLLLLLLMLK